MYPVVQAKSLELHLIPYSSSSLTFHKSWNPTNSISLIALRSISFTLTPLSSPKFRPPSSLPLLRKWPPHCYLWLLAFLIVFALFSSCLAWMTSSHPSSFTPSHFFRKLSWLSPPHPWALGYIKCFYYMSSKHLNHPIIIAYLIA